MRLAIILLMSTAAWGQQPISSPSRAEACLMDHSPAYCAATQPDTTSCIRGKTCPGLVVYYSADCPKYQHNSGTGLQNCRADPAHPNSNTAICTPVVSCVDDMHTVTEREWAELMARIKKLERKK